MFMLFFNLKKCVNCNPLLSLLLNTHTKQTFSALSPVPNSLHSAHHHQIYSDMVTPHVPLEKQSKPQEKGALLCPNALHSTWHIVNKQQI